MIVIEQKYFLHLTLSNMLKSSSWGIAEIFKLSQNSVEMLPITMFSERDHKGLVVQFLIATTEWTGTKLMDKLKEDNMGHLAVVIAES